MVGVIQPAAAAVTLRLRSPAGTPWRLDKQNRIPHKGTRSANGDATQTGYRSYRDPRTLDDFAPVAAWMESGCQMSVLGRLRIAFDRFPTFFEEPEVARYVTLAESAGGFTIPDPAAELPVSDRHFPDIDAPGLINGSLPVIFFRTTHTGGPRFGVRLNATPLTQHTFADAGPHAWHEIIPTGALKPEDNELTFAVDGDGAVTFSDVVILYKSNQLTVRRPLPEPVLTQT